MQKEAPFPGRKNIKKFADICSIHHSNYFVGDTLWIFKYSGSTFLSSNFSIFPRQNQPVCIKKAKKTEKNSDGKQNNHIFPFWGKMRALTPRAEKRASRFDSAQHHYSKEPVVCQR